jgi:hypothetical protein
MPSATQANTFTIPSAATEPTGGQGGSANDGAIAISGFRWGNISFPAAMTGTHLIVQHKYAHDGTWIDAVDESGVAVTITKQLSKSVPIPLEAFGAPFMRFKSQAAEGADRAFATFINE